MDMTFTITATNPNGVDHVTSVLSGAGFNQSHDSHPEGENVTFLGVPGSGSFTLTSQAYADRDDHEVGDPSTLTISITGPTTPVTIS